MTDDIHDLKQVISALELSITKALAEFRVDYWQRLSDSERRVEGLVRANEVRWEKEFRSMQEKISSKTDGQMAKDARGIIFAIMVTLANAGVSALLLLKH